MPPLAGHEPPLDRILPQERPKLPCVVHNGGKSFLKSVEEGARLSEPRSCPSFDRKSLDEHVGNPKEPYGMKLVDRGRSDANHNNLR